VRLKTGAAGLERTIQRSKPAPPIGVVNIGWETTNTDGVFSNIPHAPDELRFIERRVPSSMSRIEGSVSRTFNLTMPPPDLPQPVLRGLGQSGGTATVSCRWSWPGV